MTQTTQINGWTIKLDERDQYNDYSVKSDFYVEVCEPNQYYGRRFHVGTDKAKAASCYRLAIQHVRNVAFAYLPSTTNREERS